MKNSKKLASLHRKLNTEKTKDIAYGKKQTVIYFLTSFLVTFLFFGGINYLQGNLEDFFIWQENKKFPLRAQINQDFLENLKPFRNWKVDNIEIEAKAAISVFINDKGQKKILFAKDSHKKLPIASLTKLMTALIVSENYDFSQIIETSEKLPEDNGQPKVGEKFEVGDLLYFLLMTSNNGAGNALAKTIGYNSFIFLMNKKAQDLGMANTYFVNPTGLDPDRPDEITNFSTARDLAVLGNIAYENPVISRILATSEIEIYSRENLTPYKLENTNELLGKMPEILAGKTGWTPKAGGCLIVVTKAPKNAEKGEIISVILGSEKRFEEMEKLITWIKKAYIF